MTQLDQNCNPVVWHQGGIGLFSVGSEIKNENKYLILHIFIGIKTNVPFTKYVLRGCSFTSSEVPFPFFSAVDVLTKRCLKKTFVFSTLISYEFQFK